MKDLSTTQEVEHGRLDIKKLDFNKPGKTEEIHHQTLRDEAAKSDANVRSAKIDTQRTKKVSDAIAKFNGLGSKKFLKLGEFPFYKNVVI